MPADSQVMRPKNRCERVGASIAIVSAVGGFLLVTGNGNGASNAVTPVLCFAGGLILIGAGTVSKSANWESFRKRAADS